MVKPSFDLKYSDLLSILIFSIIISRPTFCYYPTSFREAKRLFEERLQDALVRERGTKCDFPLIDAYDNKIMQYRTQSSKIRCPVFDWVKCEESVCKVRKVILESYYNVHCTYKDIIYVSDKVAGFGSPVTVKDNGIYKLRRSDHVQISCKGKDRRNRGFFDDGGLSIGLDFIETVGVLIRNKFNVGKLKREQQPGWFGYGVDFRSDVKINKRKSEQDELNIVMIGFDSVSKNRFIRSMPKSYKRLREDFESVIMNGYNIIGDGTMATLFPLLTGKTEFELPDRRKHVSKKFCDDFPFIFKTLKSKGYRTLYFEDSPNIGTFNYRHTGFRRQPADHYLRHFFRYANRLNMRHRYCIGDTPSFKLMLDKTLDVLVRDGQVFAFTFISDISHDTDLLSVADDDFAEWLKLFKEIGFIENTLLIVHSDHGLRFSRHRSTFTGKIEERLPFLAIVLPENYKQTHPNATSNLRANKHKLTTPHDLYATYVDFLGFTESKNLYKVPGSHLLRGMSLLEPIPAARTCADAGVDTHWCACAAWLPVTAHTREYRTAAVALVKYINGLTDHVRSLCESRTLQDIHYVLTQAPNEALIKFKASKDGDGYLPNFTGNTKALRDVYFVKVALGPGHGVYEATMLYSKTNATFYLDSHSISRVNPYNDEPRCIIKTQPDLSNYCFCKANVVET